MKDILMKIYGAPLSPFVRKVMIYCAERSIAYDLTPIFPMGPDAQNPEFMAASPLGKIPAMDDDGFTLADSSAIIHYLEAKHGAALLPSDAQGIGQAVFFDEIADTVIISAMAPLFFNRVVKPKFMNQEGDLAAADKAEQEAIPAALAKLEKIMPDSEYLVGDSLTIADISMACIFVNGIYGGYKLDNNAFPKVATWLENILTRPSFSAQLAVEKKMMG